MAASGHIVQNKTKYKKFRIDLKWPEMRWEVNLMADRFWTSLMADRSLDILNG